MPATDNISLEQPAGTGTGQGPCFVHLNLHSEFSLEDSTVRIPALMHKLAEQGAVAVAMTDINNLFAAVKFHKAAIKAGIKPIFGADLQVLPEDKTLSPYFLTLLVQDATGYLNVSELITRAHQEGYHAGKPHIHESWLANRHQGLIAISRNLDSDIGQLIASKKIEQASERVKKWRQLFGDRFYLGMARIGRSGEAWHNKALHWLAARHQVPLVATNDVRFLHEDDYNAHEARVCIRSGHVLADPRRTTPYTRQQCLCSSEEMAKRFEDIPAALQNSVEIAKRCNFQFEYGTYYLPDFPVPDGVSIGDYLRQTSHEHLQQRLQTRGMARGYSQEDYRQRLENELDVIISMGFPGYFLIVADFIRWSRENRIPVGPGRGSGAGSLVAYVLGITDLDPLQYDLLFERFLNPERVSMPDFDIDFCMERRDEVIEYVSRTYGADKVCQIVTFGSLSAKAVIRDAGRVLGYPYPVVDGIAKLVPNDLGITLAKALDQSEEFRLRKETDEEAEEIIELAMKLEGLTRNVGKHAGGVVIAPQRLTHFCPLYQEAADGSPVSQFDKNDVEDIGLVKFDFLGLRTLTIIDWALRDINARRPEDDPVDISCIPLDDEATFDLLRHCRTTAVFQLESRGMKELIAKLQPNNFEEIIALVALFRPGPLDSGMVDTFVDCKHGRRPVEYPHPDLKEILEPTYGVMVYQEQVMQIAQVLAGYTLGAADILRRAMGKKKPEEMEKQRAIFVKGAVQRGVDPKVADDIFSLMEKFAGYGFNKSHSAAYALLAYQTAWLKTHFPTEFMAAVMSADMDSTDKLVHVIEDVRAMGLKLLPPDINQSRYKFAPADDGSILYGLGAIKGVGQAAIENILHQREQAGPFTSLLDFCSRVDLHKVNRKTLEALIASGAFDSLHDNRRALLKGLDQVLKAAAQRNQDAASGQIDMFGLGAGSSGGAMETPAACFQLPPVAEFDDNEKLFAERDVLGHFISGHPVARYQQWLQPLVTCALADVQKKAGPAGSGMENGKSGHRPRMDVVLGGLITQINRRSEKMATVVLEDTTGRMDVTFFGDTLREFGDILVKDELVVVTGSAGMDRFTGRLQVRAQEVMSLNDAVALFCHRILFRINHDANALKDLQALFAKHGKGKAQVYIQVHHGEAETQLRLGPDWKIRPSLRLLTEALRMPSITHVAIRGQ